MMLRYGYSALRDPSDSFDGLSRRGATEERPSFSLREVSSGWLVAFASSPSTSAAPFAP